MARAIQITAGGSLTIAVTDTLVAGTALPALTPGLTKIRVHNTGANLCQIVLATQSATGLSTGKELTLSPGQVEYLERAGYSHIAATCPTATQTTNLVVTPYNDSAL